MKTKVCSKCNEEKLITGFDVDMSKRDGYTSNCKSCRRISSKKWNSNNLPKKREYSRIWYMESKIRGIEYKGGKCTDCCEVPTKDTLSNFEFHHIDPSIKEAPWSKLKQKTWYSIQQELDKCVLLCKSCHIKRHSDYKKGLRQTL